MTVIEQVVDKIVEYGVMASLTRDKTQAIDVWNAWGSKAEAANEILVHIFSVCGDAEKEQIKKRMRERVRATMEYSFLKGVVESAFLKGGQNG